MSERWITAKEMEAICPSCAQRMNRNGIARVKASVIEDAAKTAGIMLRPDRIVKEMDSAGVGMDSAGSVLFYPLTGLGIPNPMGKPFKVRDIEAAVRQTKHVKDGNEDKITVFGTLLDKLSRLSKFLRVADSEDREAVETTLDIFDMDVEPLMPSSRVRNRDMVRLRDDLKMLRDDIERGDFREAKGIVKRSIDAAEVIRQGWKKQIETWQTRRQLLMSLRNMLKKNPEIQPQLVTASSVEDPITAAVREFRADKWKTMPKGWTDESRKKFWETMTGDVKHKVTKCIKEMTGKVGDPGAFCASLADRVDPGWRSRD